MASNTIEIEAKVLLQEEDYRKLVKLFPYSPRYIQTNYYIDTPDRVMAKEGFALRVRQKEGTFELTLKTPLSQGLLEKNCTISKDVFEDFAKRGVFPKGGTENFLRMLDIPVENLRILTALTTERIDVDYQGGLLSIDRNTYSGITDYEVELEYNNLAGAEKILETLLTENGIPCKFTNATKVHRAMAALDVE